MTLSTKEWGPSLWSILHTIAKLYPNNPSVKDKNMAFQLTKYLALIIPCKTCQKHYIQNYTRYKPEFSSGSKFFKWTVKIHNLVNKKNNKHQINNEKAYQITNNKINSEKLSKLLRFLVNESNKGTTDGRYLQKFIESLLYLSNHKTITWKMNDNNNRNQNQIGNNQMNNAPFNKNNGFSNRHW